MSQPKNFIIVGALLGSDLGVPKAEAKKELMSKNNDFATLFPNVDVIEMSTLEIERLVDGRKRLEGHNAELANMLNSEKRQKLVELVVKMKEQVGSSTVIKTQLKDLTNLSWKEFQPLFDNLERNGFIKRSNDGNKNLVQLIIDPEELRLYGEIKIQRILEAVANEMDIIANSSNFNKGDFKKLNLLKKKLKYEQSNT